MKYIIELTNKQKAQMDCIIEIVHRYIGFNPKLEPMETTNIEDTNEYEIGYKVGFEDGKKQAIEEIPELANKENEIYNDGYNKGLEDGYKGHRYLNQCMIGILRAINDQNARAVVVEEWIQKNGPLPNKYGEEVRQILMDGQEE